MATVGELLILIAANNAPLTVALAKSEAELKGFSATAGTHGAAAAAGFGGVGVAAGLAGLAIGAAAVISGQAASDFQEKMGIINTIAHQTPEELTRTGDAIRLMAQQSGEPLDTLTDAFYDLLSAGIPAGNAMDVLRLSTTLAIGGLATTEETVNLLTGAINSYDLTTRGAKIATDQFALAVQDGKVTAAEISATFADVAPLARQAGLGIDEISASYAFLTAKNVPAAEAMTQMNRATLELLKPNADLNALQEQTGLNFAQIASDKGLVVALQEMREAAEANNVPFQDLFGRVEGLKFALATTGPNFAGYSAELTKMHDANGTAAAQAEERMNTLHRQTAILGESFNNLLISIGTPLLGPLTQLVGTVSGAVQAFTEWSEKNPGLATNILLVAGAVSALVAGIIFLSPILSAVGGALGVIFSPVALLIGGILALAAHFGLLGEGAKGAVDGVIGAIPGILSQVGDMAGQIGAQLLAAGQAFLEWIGPQIPGILAQLGELASQVLAWIGAQVPVLLDKLGQWAQAFFGWVGPTSGPILATLGQLAGQIIGWIGSQVPAWVAQLGRWAAAFVDWVAPLIPPALAALGAAAGRLIAWVASQLPAWGAALLRWADAFMGWIAPMIPKVLGALAQLGTQLVGWVLQQIPVVAVALGKLAIEFVAWVLPKIPVLIGALGQFALAMGSWILGEVGHIAGEMLKWAGAFIGWIIASIPGAMSALAEWLNQVIAWMAGVPAQLSAAALAWGKAIFDGMMAGIGDIAGAVGKELSKIPGVELAGDINKNLHDLTGHAEGAWNISQDHVAMVHAGEMIIPAGPASAIRGGGAPSGGTSSGPSVIEHHTHIHLDEHEIGESIERILLRNANGLSSGMMANPGVTGV